MNIFVLNSHKRHQNYYFFPEFQFWLKTRERRKCKEVGERNCLGALWGRNRSGGWFAEKRVKDFRRKMLCTVTLLWSQKMPGVLQTCYCGKWAAKPLVGSDSVPVCEAQGEAVQPFFWPGGGVFLPCAVCCAFQVPQCLHNANANAWTFSMSSWGKINWKWWQVARRLVCLDGEFIC